MCSALVTNGSTLPLVLIPEGKPEFISPPPPISFIPTRAKVISKSITDNVPWRQSPWGIWVRTLLPRNRGAVGTSQGWPYRPWPNCKTFTDHMGRLHSRKSTELKHSMCHSRKWDHLRQIIPVCLVKLKFKKALHPFPWNKRLWNTTFWEQKRAVGKKSLWSRSTKTWSDAENGGRNGGDGGGWGGGGDFEEQQELSKSAEQGKAKAGN